MSEKGRALVLRAAGINCDAETGHAFEREGAEVELVHVKALLAEPSILDRFSIVAIPGGFSYGDDLGGGKVLAVELEHHLRETLHAFVDRGGLILGICNGFQVLMKLGLLPGLSGEQDVTLTFNDSDRYEDRWVWLEACTSRSPFFEKGEKFYLPVAHAEGRLVAKDDALRRSMWDEERVALRYVGPSGEAAPPYPLNPNGSDDGIAGLIDKTGRVFGLMPHPERGMFGYHHPRWTREGIDPGGEWDGIKFFRRAVQASKNGA